LIEASENERFLSLASLWEMAIKISLGKLEIASPSLQALVDDHVAANGISLLAIEPRHLDLLAHLPFHH
jgi:PIN domain nuclease of toxin-antitoxin system